MSNGQSNGITAGKLRVVLAVTIVLILVLSAASFWFFRSQLEGYASEVRKANANALVSTKDVSKLKDLEKELADSQVAIARAEKIVGDSKFYQYQNQIIADINAYARTAGIVIEGYSFLETGTPGAAAGAPPVVAGTDGPPPAGLKTTSVSITVKTPIEYAALMRFVHSIETNLTKMQLTGVSISRTEFGSKNVSTNPLTIEVYTR